MSAQGVGEPHLLYEFGDFRLDAGRRLLFPKGGSDALPIKPKVLEALLFFVEHPGQLLDKERLLAELWPGLVIEESGLTQVISTLRRVLNETPGENRYLATVPGRGYRFVADVARVADPATDQQAPAAIEPAVPLAPAPPRRPTPVAALLALAVVLGAALLTYGGFALWRAARETPAPAAASSPAASDLPDSTVAVLPFENLSVDANNAYIAFGVAESVLHRLASIPGLTVIARTSSFAVGEHPGGAREIGRVLNARYLVEGSMQRSGTRLRVTAQLIDANTGGHLWSLRFDRAVDDIFAVEDEIARSIATALDVSLNSEKHPFASIGTEAYLAYLEGRALMTTKRVADAERAIEHFAHALEIAPAFAAGYAALAGAHWQTALLLQSGGTGFRYMVRTDQQRERLAVAARTAQPLLDQAFQLDDAIGEAYILRADLKANEGDAVGAEADYRKGLALDPSYGAGHERLASLLWHIGPESEALAEIDEAMRVDPLSPRNYYVRGNMEYSGDGGVFTEAERYYQKALARAPDYHPALLRVAVIRWDQGRFAEAVRLAERALTIDPRAEWIRWPLVGFYLEVGEVDAARSVLLEAPETVSRIPWLTICLYEQHPERAADLYRAEPDIPHFLYNDVRAYVLRDAALASGRLAQGQEDLLTRPHSDPPVSEDFGVAMLAQLSLAQGDRKEAERLAREVTGDGPYKIDNFRRSWPVAVALTLLGRYDAALDLLEAGYARGYRKRWWYTYRRDPSFEPLRSNPRFQALAAKAEEHAAAELESLRQMRERGQVPKRTVTKKVQRGPC